MEESWRPILFLFGYAFARLQGGFWHGYIWCMFFLTLTVLQEKSLVGRACLRASNSSRHHKADPSWSGESLHHCESQGMMRQWHGTCKSSRCLKAGFHSTCTANVTQQNLPLLCDLVVVFSFFCVGLEWIKCYSCYSLP